MAIAENINLFALYADLGEMTDPTESKPSHMLLTISAGELVGFADAVRAYERCLIEGRDYGEAQETAQALFNDSRR
ncbi:MULTISPECIES: hypothetical protein [Streptomyces]|uniref:hypothetical protein n=1 Tax=Streptomyces TaxID=1883 RepID=UPI0022563C6D|nr:hypothetical protein [Streptomyces viridodiastaticus]MCX4564767.1 hypothetical protein [Streptomyces viridodiastaticus]